MEEESRLPQEDQRYSNWQVMSSEIVEIGDDSRSFIASKEEDITDVFVAVGKNDLDVVKWAIDHVVSPGARVFLIHVFPPITYIPTPIGRLSRNQLSKEQALIYINEENNRRQNMLQKYLRLCTNAKVAVDTMLLESNEIPKAILDLIPVVNITTLVMGSKRSPSPRLLRKGLGKGEYVQNHAPEFCEVTIVCDGKNVSDGQHGVVTTTGGSDPSALEFNQTKPGIQQQPERKFFECMCFLTPKFN